MYLGANIRKIRKAWGLQQPEFAEVFGLTRGPIGHYERDFNQPSLDFMCQLEEMTRIPIYDLCKRFVNNEEIPDAPLEREPDKEREVQQRYGKDQTLKDVLDRLDAIEKRLNKE